MNRRLNSPQGSKPSGRTAISPGEHRGQVGLKARNSQPYFYRIATCPHFFSIVSNLLVVIVPVRLRVYRVYGMILGLLGLSCPPTGSSNFHSLEKGSKYAKSR